MRPLFQYAIGLAFAGLLFAAGSARASAQEIVTDPDLNARLIEYQESFDRFLADHPQLAMGATQPIDLDGKKGKIRYTYSMQGTYQLDYGSLSFTATSPIAANRFVTTIVVDETTLTGSSHVTITRRGRTWELDCPNNVITAGRTVYSVTVEVTPEGAVLLSDPRVTVDPSTIQVSVPCLRAPGGSADAVAWGEEIDLEAVLAAGLTPELGETVAAAAQPGGFPNQKTLNKTAAGIQTTAQSDDSDVTMEVSTMASGSGSAITTAAASPCSGAIYDDVTLVVADLAAISAQAQGQGFPEAVELFAAHLQLILPTLSPPAEEAVQTFADDLAAFTSEESLGGTAITSVEQARLVTDLYDVVLSTGITTTDLSTIQTDLALILGTLQGISTDQLQAHLQDLVLDAQECLEP